MRWEHFFSGANLLQWRELQDPQAPRRIELQPFMDLVEQGAPVATLPRVSANPNRVVWYVGWRTDRDERLARALLEAFVGRTYGDMRDPPRRLEPHDTVAQAFIDEFEGRAVGLEVDYAQRKEARSQLLRMANGLLNRPTRQAKRVRPVGRILRDVEFALQAGDVATASTEIENLGTGGHLDETNLAYLEVRRLAAECEWQAILDHPSIGSLFALRTLPWRVRGAIALAVFHTWVSGFVAKGAAKEAIDAFRRPLENSGCVFSSRTGLVGPEIDICFLLADAIRRTPWSDDVGSALARVESAGHGAFAAALREVWPTRFSSDTTPSIEQAQQAHAAYDIDLAFRIALQLTPSPDRARALLQYAPLLEGDDAALEAIAAFECLANDDQKKLLANRWCSTSLERLRSQLGMATAPGETEAVQSPAPVHSWASWFERLESGPKWPGVVSRAAEGTATWSTEEVASDPALLTRVVAIITATLEDWAAEALRQALPFVVEAFVQDPIDVRLSPLFEGLFELLATDDALTQASVEALMRLGQAQLKVAPLRYTETFDTIVGAVERVDSLASSRLVVTGLELLATVPCASQESRTAAAARLVGACGRWWPRADFADRLLIHSLSADLGVVEFVPPDTPNLPDVPEPAIWSRLSGRTVGLYSLNEAALTHTERALKRACPGVRVKTHSEYVGSDALKESARNVDLFVVATKAAKHAATTFIDMHRGAHKTITYAAGKGSSSLLDAVRSWLQLQAGEGLAGD